MTVYPEREPDQLADVALPEYRSSALGHDQAAAALLARLADGRLPNGVLIHGPRGIGKATFAFALARRIFEATGDESAEHVTAQIAAGGYPNLFVLRKAPRDTGKGFYTAIRVEEVRAFVEQLRMTRGRAGHRLAIIDAIDDCNASSANALLKILEEPPADTTFLLISHRPGALLPTIRSRCFQLPLRPLPADLVRQVLVDTDAAAPPDLLQRAVTLADGRPRRGFEALLLSDDGVLAELETYLAEAVSASAALRLSLAERLGAQRDSAELRFARDMLAGWIAGEARQAAEQGARARLASANELWDKAQLSLADADTYNLDMRQTLVALFDAIRKHQLLSVTPT